MLELDVSAADVLPSEDVQVVAVVVVLPAVPEAAPALALEVVEEVVSTDTPDEFDDEPEAGSAAA